VYGPTCSSKNSSSSSARRRSPAPAGTARVGEAGLQLGDDRGRVADRAAVDREDRGRLVRAARQQPGDERVQAAEDRTAHVRDPLRSSAQRAFSL
jgi:hypothetical protein